MLQKMTPRIAVVCGGPSAEAEVSHASAGCVADALQVNFSNVEVIELRQTVAEALKEKNIDVVLPVLHGPPGEDGTFQGLLEIIGLPYVGSGVHASAFAMDKVVAKRIFEASGLPVARDVVVHRGDGIGTAARRVAESLAPDVVVKPARQGSALGIHFVRDLDNLEEALEEAFFYDEQVLVEQRIEGKEITAAVLERDGIEALPVIEIRTPPGSWYDYEHRYTPGLSEHIIPAPLPDAQYARAQEIATLAHQVLGCRDLSRADLVAPPQGDPIIIEVNTLPGMTPTSLYPDAAAAAGLSFEALVAHLVERALSRQELTEAHVPAV